MMKAMPSGISMRPSMPERKNSGRKLATIIRVELRIGMRTSWEAWKTTVTTSRRSSLGSRRFSRNRLNTFSTSTMASSTSEPMAMAIPPRLIVLMVCPKACRVSRVIRMERGMVTSEIRVVRVFIRKRNRTMTTNKTPSNNDFWTLPMELLMKLAWRKRSADTFTSAGKEVCSSASVLSRRSVRSSVLVAGCLVTVSSTASFPFVEAQPNLGV